MNLRSLLFLGSFWAVAGCQEAPQCAADRECGAHAICAVGACQRDDQACRTDSQCRAPDICRGGLCLPPGRCRDAAQCREGERCSSGVCLPAECQAHACPAGSECDLSTRACELARCDDDRPCAAGLACDPVTGRCRVPTEVAAAERCNNVDDDLDGRVDEPFNADLGWPCAVGEGACRRTGVTTCSADGADVVCGAAAGAPAVEVCDGVDNDCDGATDEGFGVETSCVAGLGACAPGRRVCLADATGTFCASVTPAAPVAEICDGVDNDCDGATDEGFDPGAACVTTAGGERAEGIVRCLADGTGTECVTTP